MLDFLKSVNLHTAARYGVENIASISAFIQFHDFTKIISQL